MNQAQIIEQVRHKLRTIQLLKAQPDFSPAEIDSVMWEILGDVLAIDESHKKKIDEMENREVNSLEEEVEKRKEMYELARSHSEMILNLFNPNLEEEKKLLDLFQEFSYDTKFIEADYNLVRNQLEEYKSREKQADELIKSAIPFEDMERELKEAYEKFISENKIDSFNVDEVKTELSNNLRLKEIIERNRELLKTAVGIDKKEFSLYEETSEVEKRYNEAREKLFLIQLRDLMLVPVSNYSELLQRTKKIEKLVLDYEKEVLGDNFEKVGNQKNKFKFSPLSFINDSMKVEHQVNLLPNIERLMSERENILKKIESIYGKFASHKAAEEILGNNQQTKESNENIEETKKEQENSEYQGPVQEDRQIVLAEKDKEEKNNRNLKNYIRGKYYIIKAKAQGSLPVLKTLEEKSKSVLDRIRNKNKEKSKNGKINYLKGKAKIGIAKVTNKVKASSKLIDKIAKDKKRIKKALLVLTLGTAIAAGSTAIGSNGQVKNDSHNALPSTAYAEEIQQAAEEVDQLKVSIEEAEKEIEEYVPAIGDKLHVNENVELYKSSTGNSLEKKVRDGDYFVNRIAVVSSRGGKVLVSSTNAGVSIDDLVREYNLPKDSYVVMAHLATGIDGEFVEASKTKASPDDYGWVKVDENMLKNIEVLEKGLEKTEEKGLSI